MPARLKALQNSLTIEEPAKQKYKEVLKADLMSSNESIRQDFLMMSGSDRDKRGPPAKRLTEALYLQVEVPESTKPEPDGLLEWACKLFI